MNDLKQLKKSDLFEKVGMAVLVGHVDGSPMMYGMDRIAAVLDAVPSFGSMGKDIVAIYGRNMTLGGSEYGISWVAYDYCDGGWTSVKDSPPPVGETVIVYGYGKPRENVTLNGTQMFAQMTEDGDFFSDEWPDWNIERVTHWRPLPAPPKEDA